MWYRFSQQGLEEKILRGDAENLIRRRLYMTGHYNPSQDEINRLTNTTMKKILDKYSNYNVIRHHVKGESLTPAVQEIVNNLIKLQY